MWFFKSKGLILIRPFLLACTSITTRLKVAIGKHMSIHDLATSEES